MQYNKRTKELKIFGAYFNFEKPHFLPIKNRPRIVFSKYCYVFPQRNYVSDGRIIRQTIYFILWWRITFYNSFKGQLP